MSGLPKIVFHGTVLFVTTSLEEGILLPANPIMKLLFYSAIGRAQYLHPVTICHFLVEGSHVHFILKVNDPVDVKGFMERFKTELAHYINRLLGRKKRTIWCEGYDSPILGKISDVIREISYLYSNPSKDSLEDSIDKYPGASSWNMFKDAPRKTHIRKCTWTHRYTVPKISRGIITYKQYQVIAGNIEKRANEYHELKIEPNAWMECYGIEDKEEQKELNKEIEKKIRDLEEDYREKRRKKGKSVMGAMRLRRENLDLSYVPKKRNGRRLWCICSDIEFRILLIQYFKSLVKIAREVYERWRVGDFSVPYPLGLYPPSMPKLAEAMGVPEMR